MTPPTPNIPHTLSDGARSQFPRFEEPIPRGVEPIPTGRGADSHGARSQVPRGKEPSPTGQRERSRWQWHHLHDFCHTCQATTWHLLVSMFVCECDDLRTLSTIFVKLYQRIPKDKSEVVNVFWLYMSKVKVTVTSFAENIYTQKCLRYLTSNLTQMRCKTSPANSEQIWWSDRYLKTRFLSALG